MAPNFDCMENERSRYITATLLEHVGFCIAGIILYTISDRPKWVKDGLKIRAIKMDFQMAMNKFKKENTNALIPQSQPQKWIHNERPGLHQRKNKQKNPSRELEKPMLVSRSSLPEPKSQKGKGRRSDSSDISNDLSYFADQLKARRAIGQRLNIPGAANDQQDEMEAQASEDRVVDTLLAGIAPQSLSSTHKEHSKLVDNEENSTNSVPLALAKNRGRKENPIDAFEMGLRLGLRLGEFRAIETKPQPIQYKSQKRQKSRRWNREELWNSDPEDVANDPMMKHPHPDFGRHQSVDNSMIVKSPALSVGVSPRIIPRITTVVNEDLQDSSFASQHNTFTRERSMSLGAIESLGLDQAGKDDLSEDEALALSATQIMTIEKFKANQVVELSDSDEEITDMVLSQKRHAKENKKRSFKTYRDRLRKKGNKGSQKREEAADSIAESGTKTPENLRGNQFVNKDGKLVPPNIQAFRRHSASGPTHLMLNSIDASSIIRQGLGSNINELLVDSPKDLYYIPVAKKKKNSMKQKKRKLRV